MMNKDTAKWQFWIDVGGTFTDCIARLPDGSLQRRKILSSGVIKGQISTVPGPGSFVDLARRGDPAAMWSEFDVVVLDASGQPGEAMPVTSFDAASGTFYLGPNAGELQAGMSYELRCALEAPVVAMRWLLGMPLSESLPPAIVRLGTTRGTNALLTRGGARTALLVTQGFADILDIGYQNRPRLFDLAIRKRQPLYQRVVEIDERLTLDGEVLRSPNPDLVRQQLETLRADGIESLAICLLNAYAQPAHEELLAELATQVGFDEVSVSSRVAPFVKIVSRGDTTTVDAYLNPVLSTYVEDLRRQLHPATDLRLLTSAGGLVSADHFVGKDSILSGPAGGVVGFSRVARAAGFERAIGFDMGGTSTDVSRFDGSYEFEYETEKAGVRVVAPMMAIETVAAGGGSICAFDGVKLTVGPASAGADPGPACYGRGGPLAVTDINFFLGKIPPEHFPFPLDRQAVERQLQQLAAAMADADPEGKRWTPIELADGFLRVANASMVEALRSVSVARGCDPRDYVMVAFGGAAPQHACTVARELGIRQILNHPDAGILSAYGMGLADVTRHRARGVYRPYDEASISQLQSVFDELSAQATEDVINEGIAAEHIKVRHFLDLRYRGLDAFLTIDRPNSGSWQQAYEDEHLKLFGYCHQGRPLEIVALRVEAIGESAERPPRAHSRPHRRLEAKASVTAYFGAQTMPTALFQRCHLQPGDVVDGPAIILEGISTTLIDPGWSAETLSDGQLLLSDAGQPQREAASLAADPIRLEVFNHHFAGIAEQMGITLRQTSSSVNVKERLDFSCALFTAAGDLVVNAPHMPVHLGAMAETVKRTLLDNPAIQPGDVFLTNDPYRGGSHLPDLTVVTPVHQQGELLFFTASRAHHAEIGGKTPGSMPPFSSHLGEEGVLIRNFLLASGGTSRFEELRTLLSSGAYPSRAVDDNLADVAAQAAANQQGARNLLKLVEQQGVDVVLAYMGHIQQAAERKVRAALGALLDGERIFTDYLDNGSPIRVTVDISGDSARVDFTGSGQVLKGNLNANRAIVTAAVLYVLRCLLDEDIPLNQGVLAPIDLIVPEGLLNPPEGATPEQCSAVVGGNVETSQRITDVLLGAFGRAAASQGTMNNTLFGDATFGYYETICGGAGATDGHPGADAVHTHMTNTRLTDPEVLEQRYPVRVEEFRIRRGSGGAGRFRGGDGVVRRLRFLRPLQVSVLCQRRGPYPPWGLDGGDPGLLGRNRLLRSDGSSQDLGSQAQVDAEAGDQLIIETPGGGGFGLPDD